MAISIVGSTANGSNTTYSSLVCSLPAGTQADDLLCVSINARGSSSVTCTATDDLSGSYTQVIGQGRSSSSKHYVFWKLATGSETSITLTFSGASNHAAIVLACRGTDQTNPIAVATSTSNSTNTTTHVSPSVTTTVDGCMIITSATTAYAGTFDYVWTTGEQAEADPKVSSIQNTVSVAAVLQPSKGATGTTTATMSTGTSSNASSTVAISPPVATVSASTGNFFGFF